MVYKKEYLISCFIASLIFFFDFLQMNILNTCGKYFIEKFSLSAWEYGLFSSLYFYCMLPMFLVAGILLDKYSVRSIIICIAGIYATCSGFLAFADNFLVACVCRGGAGACGGFCLLSVIVLMCKYFGKDNISLLSGIAVSIGMCGGICAQTPLEITLEKVGFNNSLLINFAIAILIFVMTFFIKNDFTHRKYSKINPKRGVFRSSANTIKLGICAGLLFIPVSVLCGLFGIEYCTNCYGITRTTASIATGLIFVGMILGSSFWGAFRDNRKSLLLGNTLVLVCLVLLVKNFYVNSFVLYLEMFVLGIACSSQVVVFAIISRQSSPDSVGMNEGIVSSAIMLMSAITQSFLPAIFDKLSISDGILVLIILMTLNLIYCCILFKRRRVVLYPNESVKQFT